MAVPEGAPSPRLTWDGKKAPLSFKVYSGGESWSRRPVAVASPLPGCGVSVPNEGFQWPGVTFL